MGSSHVGCMNHSVGCAWVEGSCKVAATDCSEVPSVPMSSSGFAHGTPRGPTVGAVMSLEVEPTFLAHVANAIGMMLMWKCIRLLIVLGVLMHCFT